MMLPITVDRIRMTEAIGIHIVHAVVLIVSFFHWATGCGSSLTGSSGGITSPGYPNDYTHGLSCTYIIDAGSNLVSLKFEVYSTEFYYDSVKVYDKNNTLLENLTGDVEWYVVQSATYYRVVFTTDHLGVSTGFKATWTASPSALLPASGPFIHGSCPHNHHFNRSPNTGLSFRCLERFNTSSFTECMQKCIQKSACIALDYALLCAHYVIGAGGNSFGGDVWIVG